MASAINCCSSNTSHIEISSFRYCFFFLVHFVCGCSDEAKKECCLFCVAPYNGRFCFCLKALTAFSAPQTIYYPGVRCLQKTRASSGCTVMGKARDICSLVCLRLYYCASAQGISACIQRITALSRIITSATLSRLLIPCSLHV